MLSRSGRVVKVQCARDGLAFIVLISRSDLEAIMSQLDESEIDQMIDYAQYLLSKKAIRFVPEDQSDK